METTPSIPATSSTSSHLRGFLSTIVPQIIQIIQNSRAIAFLRGRSMPVAVLQQTAENTKDAKHQPKGNSVFSQDPESKQPRRTFDVLDKARDPIRVPRARRTDALAGSGLRNATKKEVSAKVTRKRNLFLLIALAFYTLPPGIEGYSDPDPYIRAVRIRINQSVILSADAKEDDVVVWSLNPAENSSGYDTLYYAGEIPRKDGCGGYQFAKNHSIIIPSAQLCHAGTYTVEIINSDLPPTVTNLTVDVIPEVSTETTASSGTMFHLAGTTASNTESKYVNTVLAVVITVSCVFVFAIVVVVIGLCLTGKCKRIWNKAPTGGSMEDGELQTSQERRFLATTEQTTSFSPRS